MRVEFFYFSFFLNNIFQFYWTKIMLDCWVDYWHTSTLHGSISYIMARGITQPIVWMSSFDSDMWQYLDVARDADIGVTYLSTELNTTDLVANMLAQQCDQCVHVGAKNLRSYVSDDI